VPTTRNRNRSYRNHKRAALAFLGFAASSAVFVPSGAQAATTTNCSDAHFPVNGGTYAVQTNEWASSQRECVTYGGSAEFTVTSSSISNATDGAPGAYTFVYSGCFDGVCTHGPLGKAPMRLKAVTPGKLTTSVSATSAAGTYNTSYDIWTSTTPSTSGDVKGTEVMIWLNRHGQIQPAGSPDLSGVRIGGRSYDVWLYPHPNHVGDTVTFLAQKPVTSMSDVDVSSFTQYAEDKGWANPSWYLTSVDAGFEIWKDGAGLGVNSFDVLGPASS
jgi:cellulose 1,4-beta-cellobiosidase